MMKKALALAGAGALLLSVALPVLGYCMGPFCFGDDGGDLTIDNCARVYTKVYNKADTGDNSIGGKYVRGGSIKTGAADATARVYNDVNSSVIGCDCIDGDISIDNHARVKTRVYNKAYTGDNSIGGRCVSGGRIRTGDAGATALVDSLVNFTMVGYDMNGGE